MSSFAGLILPAMLLFYRGVLMSAVLRLRRLRAPNLNASRHDGAIFTENAAAAVVIEPGEQMAANAVDIRRDVAVRNMPFIQLRDFEADVLPEFLKGFFAHIGSFLVFICSVQVRARTTLLMLFIILRIPAVL